MVLSFLERNCMAIMAPTALRIMFSTRSVDQAIPKIARVFVPKKPAYVRIESATRDSAAPLTAAPISTLVVDLMDLAKEPGVRTRSKTSPETKVDASK